MLYCASYLISELVAKAEEFPEYQEDLWNICSWYEGEGEYYPVDALEHWIVSDWLADKLEEKGERVCKDLLGLTIWARTCSGQAIACDSVFQDIACDLWGDELES